jgi:hypothetical protein
MCGAATFTAVPQDMKGGACHCEMCRKWSGGIFLGVYCGSSVEFASGSPVVTFDSSDWGQRLFCGTCGSTLVWQTKDKAHQTVSAPAFDDQNAFPITSEIFIDKKPSTFALAGITDQMTEADVMAKYAPEAGA